MRVQRLISAVGIAILLVLSGILLSLAGVPIPYLSDRASAYDAIGNRSEFVSNACVAYAPTGPDRHTTVFIDAGHGGPDPGASGITLSGTPINEKSLTLAVALDLLPLLRHDGYRVAMSRIADVPVAQLKPGSVSGGGYTVQGEHADIAARVDCANASSAQLLLSIHFNSYSNPSVGGVETLYDSVRPFSSNNLRFATLVQQTVLQALAAKAWNVPDRGVLDDSAGGTPALTAQGAAYGHLLELGPADPGWFDHPSQMPGALCEPLFLTDPGEGAVAASTEGQQTLAGAFETAINRYFQTSPGRGNAG
ncbi:MAG: N-acetylmuramoyl-L-alanine amidase family protein [Chloroflexota bacterium]